MTRHVKLMLVWYQILVEVAVMIMIVVQIKVVCLKTDCIKLDSINWYGGTTTGGCPKPDCTKVIFLITMSTSCKDKRQC